MVEHKNIYMALAAAQSEMGTVKKGSDRKGAFILVDGLSSNTKAVRIDYTEEAYRDADYSELIEIISQ